jgi:Tfp pilus assembly protein PilF
VRVSTRLIDARSGFRVWGSEYDRASSDLLSLQEDIAREVAIQIAGRLLPAERSALATKPTTNAGAYDHFLRGNYFLARRTSPSMAAAITEFEAASRLDAGFSVAWARAAYAYALFVDWGRPFPGLSAESLMARGIEAANRALTIDSGAADAWMARGYLLAQQYPRTLSGVRGAFDRAVALEPDNAEAWHQYGWILLLERDGSRARVAFRRALTLEPQRAVTWMHLGFMSMLEGHTAEAAGQLDSALTIDPSSSVVHALRALVRLRQGNLSGARDDAQAARQEPGADRFWGDAPLAMVEFRSGDSATARARVDALADSALSGGGAVDLETAWLVGSALVAVGERDKSLALVERAHPRGAHLWNDFRMPELDPIREDPRFQRILSDSYWPGDGP